MDTEGAFNLALRRRGLCSISITVVGPGESEISGTIGRVQAVFVQERVLLVVRGRAGTLRLALPAQFLDALGSRTQGRESHDGTHSSQVA